MQKKSKSKKNKTNRIKNDLTQKLKSLIQNKRVGVYIDSANLYIASKRAKIFLDYIQLASWFQKYTESAKLNFYTAFDPDDENQKEYLKSLEEVGYRVISKPIKVFSDDSIKGNMDIELAVDALADRDQYDILVLISGDGDFTYLIQKLGNIQKQILVLGIGGSVSYELHQQANEYFFLDRIGRVWQTPKKKNSTKPVQKPKTLPSNKITNLLSNLWKLPWIRAFWNKNTSLNNVSQTKSNKVKGSQEEKTEKSKKKTVKSLTKQTSKNSKPARVPVKLKVKKDNSSNSPLASKPEKTKKPPKTIVKTKAEANSRAIENKAKNTSNKIFNPNSKPSKTSKPTIYIE